MKIKELRKLKGAVVRAWDWKDLQRGSEESKSELDMRVMVVEERRS